MKRSHIFAAMVIIPLILLCTPVGALFGISDGGYSGPAPRHELVVTIHPQPGGIVLDGKEW